MINKVKKNKNKFYCYRIIESVKNIRKSKTYCIIESIKNIRKSKTYKFGALLFSAEYRK